MSEEPVSPQVHKQKTDQQVVDDTTTEDEATTSKMQTPIPNNVKNDPEFIDIDPLLKTFKDGSSIMQLTQGSLGTKGKF